jgi:serine/threonine-protein kinase
MAGLVGVASVGARYTLMRELGRGATGAVYLARDQELERDVAIKLLHPHLAAQSRQASCARFFAEARIAASLRHPNILAILDVDEDARRIVMELAAGGTLREVLRDQGPRHPRRALERHAQLLSALRAAHARGIVHRDVKPANLMFRKDANTPGTEIVLGDFGVAHLPELNETPEQAVGTLAYMAPEQRGHRPASPLWDVYASAVVLYEMLTGELPWNRQQILAGHRSSTDFNLPAHVLDTCPDQVAAALTTHLAAIGHPDPAQRPNSELALVQARALRDLALATFD